ncbi:hypothetical protein SDC9_183328 [bioreactor metagenome]|uniref:Uncharacterized protein n=1 Tax=bioreactor metagenome TaxID=1076179 RepID=A0A645HBD0_9ZZZZ
MKEELEQKLQDDFKFMQRFHGDNSNLYWVYGAEIEDGWFDLIYNMCKEVESAGSDFLPTQIKQKHGRLRVYYKSNTEIISETISRYEKMSTNICEICGRPGKIREVYGWITPLCNDCYNDALTKKPSNFWEDVK